MRNRATGQRFSTTVDLQPQQKEDNCLNANAFDAMSTSYEGVGGSEPFEHQSFISGAS